MKSGFLLGRPDRAFPRCAASRLTAPVLLPLPLGVAEARLAAAVVCGAVASVALSAPRPAGLEAVSLRLAKPFAALVGCRDRGCEGLLRLELLRVFIRNAWNFSKNQMLQACLINQFVIV